MATLQEIRARLAAQDNKQQKAGTSLADNSIFSHWNADEGTTTTVRFLPDADSANPYFWIERQLIKLTFSGVKGDSQHKPVEVSVPCMEMWNETCPVLTEVRPWYKDATLKDMANKYWKKRAYLFQGFVRNTQMSEENRPENPIRRFIISPQIFGLIKASLMDPEMDSMPTDYMHGLDFNIKKTMKANYADYSTSTWARKESALTEAEQSAIEQYGLFNLADFLPKKPTEAELKVIKEMFEVSVDGGLYDPVRWGTYYKPYGLDTTGSATTTVSTPSVSVAPRAVPAVVHDAEPVEVSDVVVPKATAPSVSKDKANDILQMIRARQQAKVNA